MSYQPEDFIRGDHRQKLFGLGILNERSVISTILPRDRFHSYKHLLSLENQKTLYYKRMSQSSNNQFNEP